MHCAVSVDYNQPCCSQIKESLPIHLHNRACIASTSTTSSRIAYAATDKACAQCHAWLQLALI